MSVLERAKKARNEGEDWQLIRINPSQEEILQKLNLISAPEKPPKKKPGRPKGSKKKKEEVGTIETMKRKRGRPKGSKNKPKPQPDVPENGVET